MPGLPGIRWEFGRPVEGGDPLLARVLGAVGDCARMAWWDGSAIGLHLNGLLGLFEADGSGFAGGGSDGRGRA